ncbi:MAG: topoisomerase IV, partial [Firmicutes bacterium]|nr:topoisomerase IV [Bacillota bacterium]
IVAFTDNNKVLAVNTEKIPAKSTKSTQGVQVMKITKKGASLTKITLAENSGLIDTKHYRTKNIPAAGSFLRTEDTQMSLF